MQSSADISEIGSSLILLDELNVSLQGSFKSQTCKRIDSALLADDSSRQPSYVYWKSQVHQRLGCETFGSVKGQVDAILGL